MAGRTDAKSQSLLRRGLLTSRNSQSPTPSMLRSYVRMPGTKIILREFFFFFKEQDGGKRRIFNWLRIFSRRTRFPESGAALVLVCWSSPREFSGLHSRRAISVPSDQITDMPSLAPRWSGSAGICTHTHQGTGTCCGVT